ncbi:MAG: M28 family peptidase [Acidobacteriota bacterium]|nr:M28 family peptidase [Acidobacteriota bacterium]
MKCALLLSLFAASVWAQLNDISGERIRAHVQFLASDLLEGRGVGARGGDLAIEYIATQFALAGLKPAGDRGTYFQNFTLIESTPQPGAQISISGAAASLNLKWQDDFVGVTFQQKPDVEFDADAVFVGHGIVAPEYQWDDYKGVDVRGKVAVLFTGEPPSKDPKFFMGEALTYYGRWVYKYEEATRHGAAAVIIIHTTPTASYGWNVVRSSWSKGDFAMKLDPEAQALGFAGWVTKENGDKIAAPLGKTADEWLKMADTPGFRAQPLPLRFHIRAPAAIRQIQTRNVIGKVEGSDPQLKNETVLFSAHWDHFGIGEAIQGDAIYNGAQDNATGCGILLELARAWAALPQKPKRSAIFISVAAEEAGLLGSEYYGKHPVIPAGKTALAINYDSFPAYGRTRDVGARGSERTTAYPLVEGTARRFHLTLSPDPKPLAGTYYRSDHFSFARVGIPAFSVDSGEDIIGKPPGTGKKLADEFTETRYHQPSDEYHDDWDFSGMELYARFGFLINLSAANQPQLPTWQTGDEFLRSRVAGGVR